jgi:hypothetical protein
VQAVHEIPTLLACGVRADVRVPAQGPRRRSAAEQLPIQADVGGFLIGEDAVEVLLVGTGLGQGLHRLRPDVRRIGGRVQQSAGFDGRVEELIDPGRVDPGCGVERFDRLLPPLRGGRARQRDEQVARAVGSFGLDRGRFGDELGQHRGGVIRGDRLGAQVRQSGIADEGVDRRLTVIGRRRIRVRVIVDAARRRLLLIADDRGGVAGLRQRPQPALRGTAGHGPGDVGACLGEHVLDDSALLLCEFGPAGRSRSRAGR